MKFNHAGGTHGRVQYDVCTLKTLIVGGDVDIVAGIMKLGEQVAGNTKLE